LTVLAEEEAWLRERFRGSQLLRFGAGVPLAGATVEPPSARLESAWARA
jgi:hypothetical protein